MSLRDWDDVTTPEEWLEREQDEADEAAYLTAKAEESAEVSA